MPPAPQPPIRDRLASAGTAGRSLWGIACEVRLDKLARQTRLDADPAQLAGASVLIATRDPLAAAIALVELDGVARRIVVGTPDLSAEHLPRVVARGAVDAIVADTAEGAAALAGLRPVSVCTPGNPRSAPRTPHSALRTTEWVLLTSGTTGAPKLVVHTLATLSGAIPPTLQTQPDLVWGTFYDIRRYGGMQILLRALIGGGSLVVSGAGEPAPDYLARLATHGVTHLSGTATHWRRALMTPAARTIHPRYVRLSGEIADQGVLNSLRSFYADARVGHAFASTEAGVAFEVNDGLEGFPASLVDDAGPNRSGPQAAGAVEARIVDGSLRIRSDRTALGYLVDPVDGTPADPARCVLQPVADADGFVDTGDMIERRGDRCVFLGRRTGVINVGGNKVYPEEVEAAINRHPAVRMSLVRSRRNPITGALVAADVVLNDDAPQPAAGGATALRQEILALCRATLPPYKIPASLRFVPALDVAAAGKLARGDA
jgi:acyl-coenzyme A synthetase/AMP-(fatty) acid ligase